MTGMILCNDGGHDVMWLWRACCYVTIAGMMLCGDGGMMVCGDGWHDIT